MLHVSRLAQFTLWQLGQGQSPDSNRVKKEHGIQINLNSDTNENTEHNASPGLAAPGNPSFADSVATPPRMGGRAPLKEHQNLRCKQRNG
jgi:hypothetical protein